MERKHLNRQISVKPDGQLYLGDQVVDSFMFLIEEDAIKHLEQELMEDGPTSYPGNGDDYSIFEDLYDSLLFYEDEDFPDENNRHSGDINNDEFDSFV